MPEVPHTLDAVRTSQHIANYFIDTGRVQGRGLFQEREMCSSTLQRPERCWIHLDNQFKPRGARGAS